MTPWRPKQSIRVKAIGLAWREGRLLAADVTDDSGAIKGVRPLGGSVEFGETWQEALTREFREELNVQITNIGAPLVFENIYRHEGRLGHEVIFAANVTLPVIPELAAEKFLFHEDNGLECTARWFDLDTLDTGGPELFPTGLKTRLKTPS